ncbi:MAG: M28 family peptidase [Ginsengibacter sp.]
MNKISFFIALYLLPVILLAQIDDAQKYAATITRDDLKKHLTIIAGADMEGRETGTPGQRKAAAYIESQFRLLGLQTPSGLNGYQQTFSIYKDTLINTSLKIGKKNYVFGKDFILIPSSAQTGVIKSKQIIFVGYGIADSNYNDYAGKDVTGKIVVFFTGEPKINGKYLVTGTEKSFSWSFGGTANKAVVAKQNGALAALVINPSMENILPGFVESARKTNVYFPGEETKENEKVNFATILPSMAKEIFGEKLFTDIINKSGAEEPLNNIVAEVKSKTKFVYKKQQIPNSASNVVGFIEGSDKKDEYVFLTAHYDHLGKQGDKIYYGADDDGSGTVSVIEMAKAFAKAKAEGKGPRRTIVFMTVSGEEKGLWGSEYYSDHPIFPLEKTTADLNTDMVGRVDTERKTGDSLNYVYVIGHDKLSSDLQLINEEINDKYSSLKLDYKFDDPNDSERIYYRSDHYNFARKGVPVLFFYDGMLKADYHKPTDTVEKINWQLYEKRVQHIFLTAWEIANREDMLKRDIPLTETEVR